MDGFHGRGLHALPALVSPLASIQLPPGTMSTGRLRAIALGDSCCSVFEPPPCGALRRVDYSGPELERLDIDLVAADLPFHDIQAQCRIALEKHCCSGAIEKLGLQEGLQYEGVFECK